MLKTEETNHWPPLVLAIPIVPFLFFGEAFEIELQSYLGQDASESDLRLIVVALLSVDIFLPVPSSVISTVSGWRLGWLQGTLATWIGMTIGAIVGYLFALWLGPRFAGWFCRGDDLEGMKIQARQARDLGFSGKGAIHPKQIADLNEVFTPSAEEVARARKVVAAFEDANTGLVVVDGKLIEKPVVREMQRILSVADRAGR